MDFGDEEFALGVFGETGNGKVEPAFAIDGMVGEGAVMDAGEPVLDMAAGT